MAERSVEAFRRAGVRQWFSDEEEDDEITIALAPTVGANVLSTLVHSRLDLMIYAEQKDTEQDSVADYWYAQVSTLWRWGLIAGDSSESPGELYNNSRGDDWLGTGILRPYPFMANRRISPEDSDGDSFWYNYHHFWWYAPTVDLTGKRRFDPGTTNTLWLHLTWEDAFGRDRPDTACAIHWEAYSVWKERE